LPDSEPVGKKSAFATATPGPPESAPRNLGYTGGVTDLERIIDAAMQLPEDERARLATMLRDSLGDGSTQADIDAAVLAEVRRRLENVDSGRTTPIPYEQVKRKLDATIERARGRRASAG
jgi:putative addiction module component (TIGR02574 family)